jgi:hypothetical protein
MIPTAILSEFLTFIGSSLLYDVNDAGMEGHAYLEITQRRRPLLNEEKELGINSSLHSLCSDGEGGLDSVADSLKGIAAVGLDSALQDLSVPRLGSPHRSRVSLPEHRAFLNVGGQESHSARRRGRELVQFWFSHLASPPN